MPTPVLFYPEHAPVAVVGRPSRPNYVIYSCLQWQDSSLSTLPIAAKQTFCVMYGDYLDERVIAALEHAYLRGGMAPVKIISIHEESLKILLGGDGLNRAFPFLQDAWESYSSLYAGWHYTVEFETEAEVNMGISEYPFWPMVQEILETFELGLIPLPQRSFAEEPEASRSEDSLDFSIRQ